MSNIYMAIDIETTGLSPEDAQIIEIGAVVMENGKDKEIFTRLIHIDTALPQRIIELTGITDEMLANQDTEATVMADFLEFCERSMAAYDEKDIILGHNIQFDYSFLKTAASRHHMEFERRGIDTLKISRECHPELPSKSLDHMCAHYGIQRDISHRAYEDAIAAACLYEHMKKAINPTDIEWEPQEMLYTPKKQEPMTAKQKKYLNALLTFHQLPTPENMEQFTKSKASKCIDKIILQYGRMYT